MEKYRGFSFCKKLEGKYFLVFPSGYKTHVYFSNVEALKQGLDDLIAMATEN